MRRRAEVVREDRVLAVLAVARVAAVTAVEAAVVAEPPVPAPRRLEEVAAERAHVAELRRRRKPARLAQRVRNPRLDLELAERRPRADHPARDAARHDATHVDERLRAQQPVLQERHDLRPAVEEDPPYRRYCELGDARR